MAENTRTHSHSNHCLMVFIIEHINVKYPNLLRLHDTRGLNDIREERQGETYAISAEIGKIKEKLGGR